jgi:hypothetical protein
MTKSTENEMGRKHRTCVKRRNACRILVEKSEDLYLGETIILKWILGRLGPYVLDFSGLG